MDVFFSLRSLRENAVDVATTLGHVEKYQGGNLHVCVHTSMRARTRISPHHPPRNRSLGKQIATIMGGVRSTPA